MYKELLTELAKVNKIENAMKNPADWNIDYNVFEADGVTKVASYPSEQKAKSALKAGQKIVVNYINKVTGETTSVPSPHGGQSHPSNKGK